MTKDQRLKAMGKVISACQQIKDRKPLADAVREIVRQLAEDEAAHREAARVEHAANVTKKPGSVPNPLLSGEGPEVSPGANERQQGPSRDPD